MLKVIIQIIVSEVLAWLGRWMKDKKVAERAKVDRASARAEFSRRRADKRAALDKARDRIRRHRQRGDNR